jgi:hypothetical protein
MQNRIPRTALPGRSWSSHDGMAKGLGYFSLALGATELLAAPRVCKAAGLDGQENLIRAYGAREVATGIAILASHDATPWIWGRVAGDALDIATVVAAGPTGSALQGRKLLTLAVLLGATAMDVFCSVGLSGEKGGRKGAVADYHSRSGFPKGKERARGAARDFQIPRDVRAKDPLRPEFFESRTESRAEVNPVPAGN